MPKPTATKPHRNSQQIKGVKAQLTAAINRCYDGAHVSIDLKTARSLAQICDQAIHTEEGHEPCYD